MDQKFWMVSLLKVDIRIWYAVVMETLQQKILYGISKCQKQNLRRNIRFNFSCIGEWDYILYIVSLKV